MQIRALTRAEMKAIASWRYPGPYSTYDVDDASVLARDHWAVSDAGELIGYCCFGEPARVPGATAEPGTLDIGYGMAPERVGRGDGSRFVAAIINLPPSDGIIGACASTCLSGTSARARSRRATGLSTAR
jgi:[ribosomal protein S18]-alanine N-acetyltransferase